MVGGIASGGASIAALGMINVSVMLTFADARARGRQGRLFGFDGRGAVEGLTRSPGRTGVTTAVIALSLTLAVTVSSVGRSFRESERNWFILMGDLVVSAVATEGGWLETPESGSRRPTARHAGSGQGGNLPRSAGQPFLDSRIAVVAAPRSTKGGRACASAGG